MSSRNAGSKFWGICIPVRLVLALVVWFLPSDWLPLAGFVAMVGVVGLMYRFATYDSKQVGVFKQPVTWNNLRPIHACVWAIFAYLAVTKNPRAKFIPFADVLLGAAARTMSGAWHA